MLRSALLFLGGLCFAQANAQIRQTLFDAVRLENGNVAVSSFVYAIAEDSLGFMWFGTGHGLLRYDGYNARTYHCDASDTTSLNDDLIRSIYTDRHGWVWVGTPRGVNRYAPAAHAFKRFYSNDTTAGDWSVYHFFEDLKGTLWAGSTSGLFRYIPDRDVFEKQPLRLPSGHAPGIFSWFIADRKGRIWCIADDWPARVDLASGIVTPIDLPGDLIGAHREFHRIYFDSKNRMWLMGWPGAIYCEPDNGACHRVPLPDSLGYHLSRMIVEDARGRIWMSLRFDGIVQLDADLNFAAFHTTQAANPFGLMSKRVLAMYIDRRQTLWLGNVKGVQKCHLNDPFQFYQPVTGFTDEHNVIFSIQQDGAGGVWMGTAEQGMYSPRLGAAPQGIPVSKDARPGHTRIKDVNAVFRDHTGAVWLATGRGLSLGSPGGALQPLRIDPDFDAKSVFDVAADPDQPDYLWALAARGLLRLHRTRLRDTSWFSPQVPVQATTFSRMAPDFAGNIWLPLRGALGCFRRKTGRFTVIRPNPDDPHSFLSGEITCLAADPQAAVLWIGTPQGLSRFSYGNADFDGQYPPEGNHFNSKNYTTAEGLPDARIQSITLDAAGRVWFTTFNALCCLDPSDGRLRQFPVGSHPIWGVERNVASWLDDRRLAIGGSNGFWLFEPLAVQDDTALVPLVLSDFKISNISYPLPTAPELAREIVLTHSQNIFTFEWAGLLPASPEGLRYTYWLEGYDKAWSPLGAQRYATYTNLSPGVYYFEVKTMTPAGFWSPAELRIKVIIAPAWWQTGWFTALIALLLAVIGYFLWENARQKRHLKEQKNLAEQNAHYKSRFLANVSHEIRTPLNAIVGLNKLLFDTPLSERQREYAGAIGQSSENLLWLVNDILDQARIESGRYTFASRDFDLAVILQQLHNTFIFRAKEKNLDFRISCPPDVPTALVGDPLRLYQILVNLTGNALKFTPNGHVEVGVRRLDTDPGPDFVRLQFEVSDTGIGIAPERLQEIFESFRRLDEDPAAASQQGTGLGLSIARELVEQQGGTLLVDSTPGQGSVFRVQLGFGLTDVPAIPEKKHAVLKLANLRILLVEDTPFNQLLATELLKKYIENASIDLADNGQSGVEKVRLNSYDLVLMDVKMPVLDGYGATLAIRALPDETKRSIPIIGLTANAIPEQIARCLEAGMNEVVTKPIDAAELLEKIARFAHHA